VQTISLSQCWDERNVTAVVLLAKRSSTVLNVFCL